MCCHRDNTTATVHVVCCFHHHLRKGKSEVVGQRLLFHLSSVSLGVCGLKVKKADVGLHSVIKEFTVVKGIEHIANET